MKALKDAACGSVLRTKRGNLLLETLVKVEDMYMVGHIDETSRTEFTLRVMKRVQTKTLSGAF